MGNDSFRELEQNFWSQSACPYDIGFGHITPATAPYLLDSLNVSQGTDFLDVACGPGYIASMAKKRGATVTGIDFSTSMIELAKSLNPEIFLKVANAQALPFKENSFDSIACNFGIMHLDNPQQGFEEVFRVCRSGGRYAFVVWDIPEKSPLLDIVFHSIEEHGTMDVDLPESLPFFHFANKDVAQDALFKAGFFNAETDFITIKWKLTSAKQFLSNFRDGGARIGGILRAQTAKSYIAIEESIQNKIEPYRDGDLYIIPVKVVMTSAKKK